MNSLQSLSGFRIVDFSRLLPGPMATKILKEKGAEIVKIEMGENADWLKHFPPWDNGISIYYSALNSGKKIEVVNIGTEQGRNIVDEHIKSADILIEQFRPGVMDKMGFGYERCKSINEEILYISLTGYGQDSQNRSKPGHDLNYIAESGLLSLFKDSSGKVILPGTQLADIAAGSYALVTACFEALLYRAKNNRGRHFDISIMNGLIPFSCIPKLWHNSHAIDEKRRGFLSGDLVNYNIYESADGEIFALAALELKFWNKFCELVGRNDWKREEIGDLEIDRFDQNEIVDLFKKYDSTYWSEFALKNEVCLSRVESMDSLKDFEFI